MRLTFRGVERRVFAVLAAIVCLELIGWGPESAAAGGAISPRPGDWAMIMIPGAGGGMPGGR